MTDLLRAEAEPGTRFGVVDFFPTRAATGVPSPGLWLQESTDIPLATGLGFESTSSTSAYGAVVDVDETDEAALKLVEAGVSHLVSAAEADIVPRNSPYYTKIASTEDLELWQIDPPSQSLPLPQLVDSSTPYQEFVFSLDSGTATEVTLPVGYSPKWTAENENGATLPISRSDSGLLTVDNISETTSVNIVFRSDLYDRVGAFITGISAVLGLIIFAVRHRSPRFHRR